MPLLLLLILAGCREPNAPLAEAPQAEASAQAATADLCNIEFLAATPFGATALPLRMPSTVRGWLVSEEGGAPDAPALEIAEAEGHVVATMPLDVSEPRPDVVQAFPGKVHLESNGFRAEIDPARLSPGRYHLFLSYRAGSRRSTCDNGRQVDIVR